MGTRPLATVVPFFFILSLAGLADAGQAAQASPAARPASQTPPRDRNLGQSLLDAVNARNLAEVKSLLAAGAPLDIRDRRGRTPILLAAAQMPQVPQKRTDFMDREPHNPLLIELLLAAAKRKAKNAYLDGAVDGQGRVGASFVTWLETEGSLYVFGRGGGLLLEYHGPYAPEPDIRDVDGDGRNELVVQSGSRGTGLFHVVQLVYFFDDQRFDTPLWTTTYSYTDSSWFGHLTRGKEYFLIPPITSTGKLRFRDTDGDGINDLAEAVERRWFGTDDDSDAHRPDLADGPDWANRRLKECFELTLGIIQDRVVATWRRDPVRPAFVRER